MTQARLREEFADVADEIAFSPTRPNLQFGSPPNTADVGGGLNPSANIGAEISRWGATMKPPTGPFDENPYAAPVAEIGRADRMVVGQGKQAEAEAIRMEHIGHEASLKAIGFLYYLGGVLLVLGTVSSIFLSIVMQDGIGPGGAAPPQKGLILAIGTGYLIASFINFAIGRGLRTLAPWARWVMGIFSAFGILWSIVNGLVLALANPVAGLLVGVISGLLSYYFAYLCFSKKGRVVFSPGYKEVIALTPDIRYKTSKFVWIVLGLFLFLLVFVIAAAMIAGNNRG